MRRNDIFGTAHKFYFDFFHISVQSFTEDKEYYKTAFWEEGGLCHPCLINLLFLPL